MSFKRTLPGHASELKTHLKKIHDNTKNKGSSPEPAEAVFA